jgi:hypothetical protein
MRLRFSASLLLFLTLISFSTAFLTEKVNAANSSLGLALDVLPSNDPEINRLTAGQALWFVIPPGQHQSRQVRISSSSTIPELVTFSVGYLNRINGIATIDDSKKSETAPWASFTPESFTLAPRGSKIIEFKYQIPAGTEIGIHEAFLFATANSTGQASKAEYSVPQAARIATPIFLGVGTSAQIDTNFSIDNVSGVVVDGVRNLKVDFSNTGKTPLNLAGNVQLSSTEFKGLLIGPLLFTSVVIRPGIDSYVLIPAPPKLTPGEWKILVTATQISNTKTREFTKNINFKAPSTFLSNLLRIFIVSFFALILYFSLRVLRAPRKKKAPQEESKERVRRVKRSRKTSRQEFEVTEIDKLIEEILSRSNSSQAASKGLKTAKKRTKKAPAKKATPKKATAKKVEVKKTINKSPTSEKALAKSSPKKKTAKKAAVKKR